MAIADTFSGAELFLQNDIWRIFVAKPNGDTVECHVHALSTVQDLLDSVAREAGDLCFGSFRPGDVQLVLLASSGATMEPHRSLYDYGVGADSSLSMALQLKAEGLYNCWFEVDTSNPLSIDRVNISILITKESVSVNDVEGWLCGDHIMFDEPVSMKFKKPLTIKSERPGSRARFEADGCEFTLRSCARHQGGNWIYPIEGKLLGSSNWTNGHFKGRQSEPTLTVAY
jgi:hypothetical protein